MKRVVPAVLCVLLLAALVAVPGRGAPDTSNLIFTVVDQRLMSVLRTSQRLEYVEPDKFSFYYDGTYYVWAEYFSALSIISAVSHNAERQTVTVYNINQSLFFDYSNNVTLDKQYNYYDRTAIWRGGQIFLPLDVVSRAFSLYVQHVPVTSGGSTPLPAPILYISSTVPAASNAAASWGRNFVSRLSEIKNRYIAELTAPPVHLPESPNDPVEPSTTPPPAQPPKLVYLTFMGPLEPEATADILAALEQTLAAPVKAAFFVPADTAGILASGELLRRIYAEGHIVGLLLPDTGGDAPAAAAAFEAGNAALRKVIFTKTRLVCLEGGSGNAGEAVIAEIIDRGGRLWDANVGSGVPGEGTAQTVLSGLRTGLGRASGTAVLAMACAPAEASAVPGLLTHIRGGNYSLLTITSWDVPVNQAYALQ